jgi:hypothetical protein
MVHHLATVLLLVYSYYVNLSRLGVMILLIHDVSDIFMEAAKLSKCVHLFFIFLGLVLFIQDVSDIFLEADKLGKRVYFSFI